MAEMLEPDFCVIGCGPGAVAAAVGAAAHGLRVVLVRHGPSSSALKHQALLSAAARAHAARSAGKFGVEAGEVRVDFDRLKDHIQSVAAAAAPNQTPERLTGLGIRMIGGSPRFTGANALAVDERFEIKPKHVVIATGSEAILPQIEGLNGDVLTPESVFDLAECPTSLAVIGASAQGLELAQAFLRLGAEVAVIDAQKPLSGEDAECVAILLRRLQTEGIAWHAGRPVRAAKTANAIELTVEQPGRPQTIRASHVLVAEGRRPALDGLDLSAGRIVANASGITVDDHLRSSNPKVFAIGEAIGAASIQAANQHAAIVIRNALNKIKAVADGDVVPRVIFTDPEFAHVGLGEEQARARHRSIHVLRWPFHENDRARAERDVSGHVKLVTLADGRVIGATIVGRGACDQIGSFSLAIERRLGVHDLAGWILPYPSRAEAGKQALTGANEGGLTRPAPSRIISLLRRRG
jgi:pyruvate/2-oxoglutarate dehydrogenase complex dihydrolipoamide dehydrogenase (E3) component